MVYLNIKLKIFSLYINQKNISKAIKMADELVN